MFKNENNFKFFLENNCKYYNFNFKEYLNDLKKQHGETGLNNYELSRLESKSGRPELFSYETETNGDGETVYIF